MIEIIIKETNTIKRIEVINPKTGLDWSGDLIENANPEIEGYDDEGRMIMTAETFDWWETYCAAYENADKALYDFFQELKNDCWEHFSGRDPEDAYLRETETTEKFHNYIAGVEFNDIPSAMVEFVKSNS